MKHAQKQPQQLQDWHVTSEKIHRIKAGIEKGQLSDADRHFLIQTMDSPKLVLRCLAYLGLQMAADKKLFDVRQLLRMIEDRIIPASPGEAEIYAEEYKRAIGLGRVPDEDMRTKHFEMRNRYLPDSEISADEKSFIGKLVSNPKFCNRAIIAEILVRKMNLKKESSNWPGKIIQEQIRQSKNQERAFWEFILRVFRKRNPTASLLARVH